MSWMKENLSDLKPATERQYTDIFNTEFNIGFFIPKKDQCEICLDYRNSSEVDK